MAAAVVKTVYISNNSGSVTTAVAPSQTYGSGNTLAVFVEYGNASTRTVTMTDGGGSGGTNGSSWVSMFSQVAISTDRWAGFYLKNINAFTGTITATFSAASQFGSLLIFELSGLATATDPFLAGNAVIQNTPGSAANALTVSANVGATAVTGIAVGLTVNDTAPAQPAIGTTLAWVDQGIYWSFGGESGTGSHAATSTDGGRAESFNFAGVSGSQSATWSPGAGGISDGYANMIAYFSEPLVATVDPGVVNSQSSGVLGPTNPFSQMFRRASGLLVPRHAAFA